MTASQHFVDGSAFRSPSSGFDDGRSFA